MRGSDFAQLKAFVAVAQNGNFRLAASALNIAPSTLSQTISTLEKRLGVQLLNRTTRSVNLTHAGTHLLERLLPAFLEIQNAVSATNDFRNIVAGPLRIVASKIAAEKVLSPIFKEFVGLYPEIKLEIHIDDSITNIVEKNYDVGIRIGNLLEKDMISFRLTKDLCVQLIASPDYLARHGTPKTLDDLHQHNCIQTGHSRSAKVFPWRFRQDSNLIEFTPAGSLYINDENLTLDAVVNGIGIGCLLAEYTGQLIAEGRIVSLLDDWMVELPGLHIYYPKSRHMSAAQRALIDYLKEKRREWL